MFAIAYLDSYVFFIQQQPTVTRTGSYNPGKNFKGQQARAKKQHTGPVQMKFIDDKQARAQTLYRRKKTLITKVSAYISRGYPTR